MFWEPSIHIQNYGSRICLLHKGKIIQVALHHSIKACKYGKCFPGKKSVRSEEFPAERDLRSQVQSLISGLAGCSKLNMRQTCIAIEVEPVMSEERKVWGEGKAMMRAQAIRQGRYGTPCEAFKMECVPIPEIAPDECLIRVMAAGINYNGIWAAKGEPVDVISLQKS